MNFPLKYKYYLIIVFAVCILFSIIGHRKLNKCVRSEIHAQVINETVQSVSDIQVQINQIFNHVERKIPKVTFTHMDYTTSAKNSKAFIRNPKKSYCVGDLLTVQIDAYDYLGKKKTYGGDYLRAIISNSDGRASGRIEDCNNGTYYVNFTVFWEGKVVVTVYLMHPSEAVSAIWKARNSWHGYVDYLGRFTSQGKQAETKCGFDHHDLLEKDFCEYKDERDEEYFYCVKHPDFSCESFTDYKSWITFKSQLTNLEDSLFVRSNVRVEIPTNFQDINVSNCNSSTAMKERKCETGMKLEFPSGYFMKEIWYPKACSMKTYHGIEELNNCMKGKFFYFFGDSTVRQWILYLKEKLKTLTPLNLYETGWSQKILAVDVVRNIQVVWKRHRKPFINAQIVSEREERSIPREIDLIGGNQYTVIAVNIGVHFKLHPVHHFIRRLLNIRRAIERLFIRSPETKVIIKTENTSGMDKNYEAESDFHASVHYLITEMVFKDLNVGFVNGWDMTTAWNTNEIHPPEPYLRNEINMLMTYICS